MFEYTSTQKTLSIAGVRIGGMPGMIPTVAIPSIFYSKDRLVVNAETGDIDEVKTEETLSMLQSLSEKTGISTMLDVVASSPVAMEKYLTFLADSSELPLLIDGSGDYTVNSAGLRVAQENGFLDKVVLNSLTPDTKEPLLEVIKETGLQNVLLLTFSTAALISVTKRVELANALIQKAQELGISNILIDTGVMDLPTLGIACKTQMVIKDKYGYPVGNGAHNAISTWNGLVPKFGKDAKTPALVGSNLMPVVLGADFVLIGPAKHAPVVYPSIAMIDTALAGCFMESRIRPEKPHPRYLIG
ncbi:MAG: tetrahydromethanopterin S-methyltransferase subunit H [Candidatus Thorarchaeota archaeon]